MRTNILRHVAVALGMAVCTVAQAGDYNSPSKWNNFNTKKAEAKTENVFKTVGTGCLPCQRGARAHNGGTAYQGQVIQQAPGAMYSPVQSYQSSGAYQGGVIDQGAAYGHQHGVIQNGGVQNGGIQYGGMMNQGSSIVGNGAGMSSSNGVIVNGGMAAGAQGSTIQDSSAPALQGSSTRSGIAMDQGMSLDQGTALNQGTVLNQGTAMNQGTVLNQGVQGPAMSHSGQGVIQNQGTVSPYANAVQAPWTGSSSVVTQNVAAPQAYYSAPAASYGYSSGYTTQTRRRVGSKLAGLAGGNAGCGISPYFGGFNVLFLSLNNNNGSRNLLVDDATGNSLMNVNRLSPSDRVGFDVHGGRYLANGLYGLDFGYFSYNPDQEQRIVNTPGGSGRATMPQWRDVLVDPGTGLLPVYDYFDGAENHRFRRDLNFQSIEANLFSFGWMGARRTGASCNQGLGRGLGFGSRLGLNGAGRYGGAGGALTRGGSRVQVATSHGFRWFQLEDSLEIAGNINAIDGYQADDLFYNVNVENNLFGYQFGGRLTYALTNRLLFNIGGKFGLYGNDVDYRQRLGTQTVLAYTAGTVEDIESHESDTVFSTLGELDLGLGYRFSNAWTVTGGYRVISACGVSTAPGQIAGDYSTLASSAAIRADDCITLHGGYVGLQYNW